jgi:SAM-dependent methyltransferase
MMEKELLEAFIAAYPAQPATAYWRSIEIGALARLGLPKGLGLDLGCGDGILTEILLKFIGMRDLVGIDIDPLETKAAQKFSFYQRVHTCAAQAIPEANASFDMVLSNSVLEHIPDLEGVIAEVSRLLRPQGQFFFTVPGPGFHNNLAGAILPLVTRENYLSRLDRRLAHHHYLSADDWRLLCARYELVVDSCFGYLGKAQTQRWETLSRMTGGLFYSLFGEQQRPIEIQRQLGARSFQNRLRLPRSLAKTIASLVRIGVTTSPETWLPPDEASCLLVTGHRA